MNKAQRKELKDWYDAMNPLCNCTVLTNDMVSVFVDKISKCTHAEVKYIVSILSPNVQTVSDLMNLLSSHANKNAFVGFLYGVRLYRERGIGIDYIEAATLLECTPALFALWIIRRGDLNLLNKAAQQGDREALHFVSVNQNILYLSAKLGSRGGIRAYMKTLSKYSHQYYKCGFRLLVLEEYREQKHFTCMIDHHFSSAPHRTKYEMGYICWKDPRLTKTGKPLEFYRNLCDYVESVIFYCIWIFRMNRIPRDIRNILARMIWKQRVLFTQYCT